jgi:hypothetical protein
MPVHRNPSACVRSLGLVRSTPQQFKTRPPRRELRLHRPRLYNDNAYRLYRLGALAMKRAPKASPRPLRKLPLAQLARSMRHHHVPLVPHRHQSGAQVTSVGAGPFGKASSMRPGAGNRTRSSSGICWTAFVRTLDEQASSNAKDVNGVGWVSKGKLSF